MLKRLYLEYFIDFTSEMTVNAVAIQCGNNTDVCIIYCVQRKVNIDVEEKRYTYEKQVHIGKE